MDNRIHPNHVLHRTGLPRRDDLELSRLDHVQPDLADLYWHCDVDRNLFNYSEGDDKVKLTMELESEEEIYDALNGSRFRTVLESLSQHFVSENLNAANDYLHQALQQRFPVPVLQHSPP